MQRAITTRRRRRAIIMRMTLVSTDYRELDKFIENLIQMLKKHRTKVLSLVRLPTRVLVIPVRKSPCGEGTESYEHYELRVHRRLLLLQLRSTRDLVLIMSATRVPSNLLVEIRFERPK